MNAVNDAPSIVNPGDQTAIEGDNVILQITATDPDTLPAGLTFSVTGLPSGLWFNTATNEIEGQLDYTNVPLGGGAITSQITVSDATSTVTDSFDWNIANSSIELVFVEEYRQVTQWIPPLTFVTVDEFTGHSVALSSISTDTFYIRPGNFVRVSYAPPGGEAPPAPTDTALRLTKPVASDIETDFVAPPVYLNPEAGGINELSVGVNSNLDFTMDWNPAPGGEKTHGIDIQVWSADDAKVLARRIVGSYAEPTSFETDSNEHLEIGGTFEFTLEGSAGPHPMARWEIWDTDGLNDLLAQGAGAAAQHTFVAGDIGNAYILFYLDENGNGASNSGEPSVASAVFQVQNVSTLTFDVGVLGLPEVDVADVNDVFHAATKLLRQKISFTDYRSAVRLLPGSIGTNSADINFVVDSGVAPPLRQVVVSGIDDIVIEWAETQRAAERLAFGIGRAFGIATMGPNSVAVMASESTGTGHVELTQAQADAFD